MFSSNDLFATIPRLCPNVATTTRVRPHMELVALVLRFFLDGVLATVA